eukprot:scaffold155110_cov37-Tisochrysis_lutea.AAC.1
MVSRDEKHHDLFMKMARSHAEAADPQSTLDKYRFSPVDQAFTAQAQWYVYARMHVSKSGFDDPYFKNMMEKQAFSYIPAAVQRPGKTPVLSVKEVSATASSTKHHRPLTTVPPSVLYAVERVCSC